MNNWYKLGVMFSLCALAALSVRSGIELRNMDKSYEQEFCYSTGEFNYRIDKIQKLISINTDSKLDVHTTSSAFVIGTSTVDMTETSVYVAMLFQMTVAMFLPSMSRMLQLFVRT